VVYKARDPELDRVVALKRVRPDLALPPAARERFHQEARAAGRLSHPGIVAVHDVIDVAGTPCLVLEYVNAGAQLLLSRRGRAAPGRAAAGVVTRGARDAPRRA
jgi:serine/threonine protein kinase